MLELHTSTQNVSVSSLVVHTISVVIPIKKQVAMYKELANISPKTLPVVKIGRVLGKLYVLSNFDVYFGIKESRLDSVDVEIIEFDSEREFIMEHVKQNKNPIGYNPLLLFNVINYFEKKNITKDDLVNLLQLQGTLGHKFIELPLDGKANTVLCDLFSFLAEKLSNFVIPFYLPEMVSKFNANKQSDVAEKISNFVKTGKISDSKFTWPSADAIETLLSSESVEHLNYQSVVVSPPEQISSKKEKVIADTVAKQFKHAIIIPGNDQHPTYVVDKKTNKVSKVNDYDNETILEDVASKPIFVISPKLMTHLGVDDPVDVKMKFFSTSNSIVKFLEKNPDISGVLFFK